MATQSFQESIHKGKNTVLWNLALYTIVGYQRFGGTYILHLQVINVVKIYQIARRLILEDSVLHSFRYEYLKSYTESRWGNIMELCWSNVKVVKKGER
jgi:hypothetical protein